jgi:hypothetical protein
MACIICGSTTNNKSIEHIIPRTLGNIHYILAKGIVCQKCNNKFSRFESKVLSSPIFILERKKRGLLPFQYQVKEANADPFDWQRFVIKIGYEALYHSKRKMWTSLPHVPIKRFLLYGEKSTFLVEKIHQEDFFWKSIPAWINYWRLRVNSCRIYYGKNKHNQIAVLFIYGPIRLKARIK